MTGLLSVREVAERLAVSRKTVYRLLERGDLCLQTGQILPSPRTNSLPT